MNLSSISAMEQLCPNAVQVIAIHGNCNTHPLSDGAPMLFNFKPFRCTAFRLSGAISCCWVLFCNISGIKEGDKLDIGNQDQRDSCTDSAHRCNGTNVVFAIYAPVHSAVYFVVPSYIVVIIVGRWITAIYTYIIHSLRLPCYVCSTHF
jgi:hypothetical protein